MAAMQSRTPLAALLGPRIQTLGSKNSQTTISASLLFPGMKHFFAASSGVRASALGKRPLSATTFEDRLENTENAAPKRAKRSGTTTTTTTTATRPILSPKRRAAPSVITTSTTPTTPISASRGSPKDKRVGLIAAKGRRASSLGGPTTIGMLGPVRARTTARKGKVFAIREDTKDEEPTNMLLHCANILDISTDDDLATKRRKEAEDRGKENIPPPGHFASLPVGGAATPTITRRARKVLGADAVVVDREPLAELDPEDFYAPGLTATSSVVVRADDVVFLSADEIRVPQEEEL